MKEKSQKDTLLLRLLVSFVDSVEMRLLMFG